MKYRELPFLDGTEERHAWEVFPPNDELGTINRIGPGQLLAATATPTTSKSGGRVEMTSLITSSSRDRLSGTGYATFASANTATTAVGRNRICKRRTCSASTSWPSAACSAAACC
jgi:hypothetical protein